LLLLLLQLALHLPGTTCACLWSFRLPLQQLLLLLLLL
jgi:hypothetical protein